MIEVLIVGSRHPCIRCLTIKKYVEEIARHYEGKIILKYVTPESEEAKRLGKVEDGYHISIKEKIEHDHEGIERINREIEELRKNEDSNWELIKKKMEELEEKLKPIKEKAREANYLMTPVVAVNGEVKSWGYVPSKETILQWIKEAISL